MERIKRFKSRPILVNLFRATTDGVWKEGEIAVHLQNQTHGVSWHCSYWLLIEVRNRKRSLGYHFFETLSFDGTLITDLKQANE
jgi:hypothetical protein